MARRPRQLPTRAPTPPSGGDPAPASGVLSFFASLLSERITLAVGWLVFSGYVYIRTYLEYFGLSVVDADIEPATFIYYSFRPVLGVLFSLHQGVLPLVLITGVLGCALFWAMQQFGAPSSVKPIVLWMGAFVFAFVLADHMARVDARMIARGGGTMVQFVFKPEIAPVACNPAHDAAVREQVRTSAGNERILTTRDFIATDLARANECRQLRLVWRVKDGAVVARAYPNAFCTCAAGDALGGEEDVPFYCRLPARASSLQMPETYIVPNDQVELAQTTRVGATNGGLSGAFRDRWRRECDTLW